MTTIVGHIRNGFLDRIGRYKPYSIVVWLALVNRADTSGKCWPSITTIQRDTGLGRPTVYRALNELVQGGEITIESGGGKGNQSNVYTFQGSPQGELVPDVNWFPTDTKVVPHRDKGSSPREHEPDTRTRHKNQTAAKAPKNGYTDDFETFWSAVAPHKRKSKSEAFRRYQKSIKALKAEHDDPAAHLLDRARAYYASPLGQTQFCHGPAPWLHQGGYDDDPAAWERNENGKPIPEKIVYRR